jgi:16S rRNA (adenine1518-N6/adenine1519-N6)-dimethyltransferase
VGQRLGQHFLIKGSILERIAAAACPVREELVIEIGPGRGALTQKLVGRADRVIAVELDPFLADHIRARYPVEVVHADVLDVDLSQWGPAAIVGNLPYYITSPILEKVLPLDFRRAVFLMQKEVAERIVAAPGSRDYGYLTVQTAVFAQARLLFAVKPSAFHPPPKVDSAVVLLERRPPPVADVASFLRFAGRCFRYKRKTIRNNLADLPGIETWPEAGLRAEQIGLEQFVAMYERQRAV